MLIVTIAALVMAASLGWFAYRLLRDEQRRTDARVALLTAAIEADDTSRWDPPARGGHVGFVSRRAARPPMSPPSSTPVPAPATGTEAPGMPELVFLENETTSGRDFVSEHADWMKASSDPSVGTRATTTRAHANHITDDVSEFDSATPRTGLFGESAEPQRRNGFTVVMLGALLAAILALTYTWLSSGTPAPATAVAENVARATAPASGGMPLELLSLGQEQRKGALVVHGLVRNPVSGSDRADLVASVMLLDAAGGVLGSGRAPLGVRRLRPGQETAFTVELPSHADVRRYRVTFRAPDGSLVAHADRRARTSSSASS